MSDLEIPESMPGIAVIGMSGRFPGAKNVEEFWLNVSEGIESISFFTDEEVLASGSDPDLLKKPGYVKARAILGGPELFDASFFGFTPAEASILDPQQRLFLECSWEALENAGYDSERYQGLIGVYAGVGISGYWFNLYSNPDVPVGTFSLAISNDKDHLSTRVSYKLNLRGPSVTVQTACSTSLVAVHLACQSLRDFECDMALAGGGSVAFPQKTGYLSIEGGVDSPDGHCRPFDARANGTVRGNGVGVVVLKRLADAIEAGDYIHAVIKGSAINNDGRLKAGYTAPSVDGQSQVIMMAQAEAGVSPQTVTYVETHGTGTFLGDPIEVAALTQAFRESTMEKGFCAIGSVKSNIGHLDSASGVAGLIKTVFALKHRMLPPSLHFDKPNPKIDFQNSPFYVNSRLSEWKTDRLPRRAGVSSFGIGGTNAHVVVEEAPAAVSEETVRTAQLLLLSAKTRTALDTATADLLHYLRQDGDVKLPDIAYTLQVGRKPFQYRRTVVCRSNAEALNALETLDPKRTFTSEAPETDPSVIFMFPGQGSQYVKMGAELYRLEPYFREQVDRCSSLLEAHLGLDLREALFGAEDQAVIDPRIDQTMFTQPALFVIEYALARLWMQWGVKPQAMIGHSIGEYVAACLSGVFSLEDALALIATRGRLMQKIPGGAMMAVDLGETDVSPLLDQRLSLAVVNSPSLCVVSGPEEMIAALEHKIAGRTICRRLNTSTAFHSSMMEPILQPFMESLKKVKMFPPQIPFLSNLTGNWITAAEATDPKYWARHLRQTVRFADGMRVLLQNPALILLEVGPGRTLSSRLREYPEKTSQHVELCSLRHPSERASDFSFLMEALGKLWANGVTVNWAEFHAHEKRNRLPLPSYPFERARFWIEPSRKTPAEARLTKDQHRSTAPVDGQEAPDVNIPASALFPSARDSKPEGLLEQTIAWQMKVISERMAQQTQIMARQLELLGKADHS